jgi:hypothetical protein
MKKIILIFYITLINLCVTSNAFSDGKNTVASGGLYNSYEHSFDGSDVACGGLYNSYEHSFDGTSVCAGGLYNSYEHSF